jgi:outer membrane protein OmpA-like peptidoglycan-associated protein
VTRASAVIFVCLLTISSSAFPQEQRTQTARYDLNGEWVRQTNPAQKGLTPSRMMIQQIGGSIVARSITENDSIHSGGSLFRGAYSGTVFEIEHFCARAQSSHPQWVKETAEVLDGRHLRISGKCSSKDGWTRTGSPAIALETTFLFDINGSDLKPDAQPVLETIARMLGVLHPGANLLVAGYTDDLGTDAHNRQLSTRRARAVAEWFEAHGFDRSRITVKGFGEKDPRYPNVNDEARAQNRRIEIVITE